MTVISTEAVITLVDADNDISATFMVFSGGKVKQHDLRAGGSFKVGFMMDVPQQLAERVVVMDPTVRTVPDKDAVAAELSAILFEAENNPTFDFPAAVDEMMLVLFGYREE